MNAQWILLLVELIDLAQLAVSRGPEMLAAFERHRDRVRDMVLEGRDPTDAEILELRSEIDDLRARLHAFPAGEAGEGDGETG